jgi:hypothetical protein
MVALVAVVPLFARADVYETAFFSTQINSITGSLAGLGLSDGGTISGKFVFDLTAIPAAGSGMENVPFSDFPDIGAIPPSLAFQLTFGTVEVNLTNLVANSGALLYDNGQFTGFDAQFEFTVNGQQYLFQETGNSWDIELLENGQPTGDIVVSGTFDFGKNSLSNIQPLDLATLYEQDGSYQPPSGSDPPPGNSSLPPGGDPPGADPPPVPEPRMLWVLLPALATLVIAKRFRSHACNHQRLS